MEAHVTIDTDRGIIKETYSDQSEEFAVQLARKITDLENNGREIYAVHSKYSVDTDE
jgi:hypothetical protein